MADDSEILRVVRPGDTLVIATARDLDDTEAEALIAQFRDLVPDVTPVLVTQCTGLAVHRPTDTNPNAER